MQFKHPEILYALLLVIIPIFIHLFQLQRFVKVLFTNVTILKTIEKQTRKSAHLKKWLILLTRSLIFICLILAFSQPYFSNYGKNKNYSTTIYLDNSFSMQAKGEYGELLKNAAQKLIENNTELNSSISLITNDKIVENLDPKNFKEELISLKYYPNKLQLNTILLKASSLNLTKKNTSNKIILISDFQNINIDKKINIANVKGTITLLKLKPKTILNIFIDSMYLEAGFSTETMIKILLKSTKKTSKSVPVSLFNNSKLIGKTTANFNGLNHSIVQFSIPNLTNFNGEISLNDASLEFDNTFYFSISKPEKINVLSIGNTSNFLSKIYTNTEFNFTTTPLQNLNYSTFQKQQLIILNEIVSIPTELINSLYKFYKNGSSFVIIPSVNAKIDTYNKLFATFQIGNIKAKTEGEHKIITINYEHPLLKDVFDKRVQNFQYPKTSLYYPTYFNTSSSLLKYDNNLSFISSIENNNTNIYWVSSPLNNQISNFSQSPLIVPIFYNFAKKNIKIAQLYYTIEPENKVEIKTIIGKDKVLKISNENQEFIPLQIISKSKVILNLQGSIVQSGFYNIKNRDTILKTIAFNYNREESDLTTTTLEILAENYKNVTIAPSIATVFKEINNQQKINWLFKWFLAFSALFLLIEMLLLKYFKI